MRTTHEYKVTLSRREQNGGKLIDEIAIEKGHTDKKLLYTQSGFDSTWRDQQGNDVTSGYRMTKDGLNSVLITVTNTYHKDNKNSEQVVKFINMD